MRRLFAVAVDHYVDDYISVDGKTERGSISAEVPVPVDLACS